MSHAREVDYRVGILTVSTSRWKRHGPLRGVSSIPDDDESGKLIAKEMPNVVDYALVPDVVEEIRSALLQMLCNVDVCIVTGGTGLSPSDVTIEAIEPLYAKKIEGFGEIFRRLSYEEIGFDAILSRASAGIVMQKVVFCLPGSVKAVRLGLKIIKEVVAHVLTHVRGLA